MPQAVCQLCSAVRNLARSETEDRLLQIAADGHVDDLERQEYDALLEDLEISQPTLSYHMKILCRSGIVRERAVGPWKYYAIDGEGCAYAQKLLQALSFGGEKVEIRLIRALGRLSREKPPEEKETPGLFACHCQC